MFRLKSKERLTLWKNFRQLINSLPLGEAIQHTNNFWHACPFSPYYLDPALPESWPDPWQLIIENTYCDLAKCLGIVYTLHLSAHTNNIQPEIRVYYDTKTRYSYHLAYFDHGKYVLNLIENEVVNKEHITQNFNLKYCYTAVDLKLEQY